MKLASVLLLIHSVAFAANREAVHETGGVAGPAAAASVEARSLPGVVILGAPSPAEAAQVSEAATAPGSAAASAEPERAPAAGEPGPAAGPSAESEGVSKGETAREGSADPVGGASESFDGAGKRHAVVLIPGDGIGPEISHAARRIIDASGARIDWDVRLAGQSALDQEGTPLPQGTIDAIRRAGVALKAPLATPAGGGYRSINLTLRKEFDLYANYRPARNIPGIVTPHNGVDVIIMRENLEDLYVGEEKEVAPGVIESIRRISYDGSARIVRAAFEKARLLGRKKVTAVHKANIIKLGDGMFLKAARNVAKEYPEIQYDELIVDATAERLARRPQTLDVLVTPNVWGDILSDLAAGLVGGLGLTPSATYGDKAAIFEAVHGTAPDIAGKGIANPTAFLRSAILMLQHLGELQAAARIEKALFRVLADPVARTGDLGGKGTTASFADAVIAAMGA